MDLQTLANVAEQGQPSWAEWYQWLVEQLERQSGEKESSPAHQQYRSWRPCD